MKQVNKVVKIIKNGLHKQFKRGEKATEAPQMKGASVAFVF
ncbi:MAG: hypothetical protein ACQEW5_21665 [Bacillota bacterium]